jgi:hypothetical protein
MAERAPHAMAAAVSVCVLLSWCWQWAGRCRVTSRGHGPRRGLQQDDDTLLTKPAIQRSNGQMKGLGLQLRRRQFSSGRLKKRCLV